jgi:CBS domain-containing protein
MIYSTPVIITRADSTIQECVALMRKNKVSSVLIVSDDAEERLIGIFTERDLLTRIVFIEKFKTGTQSIHTVMTPNPIVIHLSEIDQAGRLMLENNIRHLPVVIIDDKSRQKVVGVISMRDLFRNFVLSNTSNILLESKKKRKRTDHEWVCKVYSQDTDFMLLAKKIAPLFFKKEDTIRFLSNLEDDGKVTEIPDTDEVLYILDIDQMKSKAWTGFLKQVTHNERARIVIAFSPQIHAARTIQVLNELQTDSRFSIFKKPVDVVALSEIFGKHIFSFSNAG